MVVTSNCGTTDSVNLKRSMHGDRRSMQVLQDRLPWRQDRVLLFRDL